MERDSLFGRPNDIISSDFGFGTQLQEYKTHLVKIRSLIPTSFRHLPNQDTTSRVSAKKAPNLIFPDFLVINRTRFPQLPQKYAHLHGILICCAQMYVGSSTDNKGCALLGEKTSIKPRQRWYGERQNFELSKGEIS